MGLQLDLQMKRDDLLYCIGSGRLFRVEYHNPDKGADVMLMTEGGWDSHKPISIVGELRLDYHTGLFTATTGRFR